MTRHIAPHAPAPELLALEPRPMLDLAGMLRVVWNGMWIIVLVTACCISMAGYYAFRMAQPQFAATATLQIDVTPSSIGDISHGTPSPQTDAASLNTQAAILRSNQLLGQVVHQLDLLNDPEFNRYLTPPSPLSVTMLRNNLRNLLAGTEDMRPDDAAVFEKTVQNLRAAVTIQQPRDTYILEITARSRFDAKAAQIANAVAAVYLMDQIHAKDAAAQEAEAWLTGRVAALQDQLQTQEAAITDLISTAQIQEDAELDNLSNQVLAADQKLDAAQTALALIEAAFGATATPRLQVEAREQRAHIAAVTVHRDGLLAQLSAQSQGLAALHQLQRQADATKVLYQRYLARLQVTRMQRGLEQPDSRLIASATTGTYAGPRKTLIVLLGGVAGALLGLATITVLHTSRRGVFDAITLRQETGVQVMAQVPLSKSHRSRAMRRSLRAGKPVFGKAMHDLRTALSVTRKGKAPQTILLTASLQNEGKTAYAVALAQSFARSGKSVLMLAGDPGSDLQKMLRWKPNVGVSDILTSGTPPEEAITQSAYLQTDLLCLSNAEQDDTVLLSDNVPSLMENLMQRYDHIIIDAPPILSSSDTLLLAQYADCVVVSVAWSKTPLALVQLGLETLQSAGSPAAGLIFSKINMRKMRRLSPRPYLQTQTVPMAI